MLVIQFFQRLKHFSQRSIFIKLFFIFLATALVLVLVIRGFFHLGLDRNQSFKADLFKNLSKYSMQLVDEIGDPPDRQRAMDLARDLGVQFRVKSPVESWTTDSSLPLVSTLKIKKAFSQAHAQVGQYRRHPFVLVNRNGTQYALFFLHRPFEELPAWTFLVLVGLVGLVISVSYVMVHRLFRPLNWLNEGVREITKGHFDHQVPVQSTDELGRLTESFNEMAQKVSEMILARDRLLLDVGHELRSPLTRMKVAVEFIEDPSTKEKLQQEIRELEAMVTELLESERLNSDSGDLTLSETDLVMIVKDIVDSYADIDSGVCLVSSPQSCCLAVDRQRVHIALRNLIDNAVKYSRPEYGPVILRIEAKHDVVTISVQDYGIGIPFEEQSRVFEPFYRVDPSRTRNTGGYGLGLSLVRKIMMAHDGEVVLAKSSQAGSMFVLKFPIHQ